MDLPPALCHPEPQARDFFWFSGFRSRFTIILRSCGQCAALAARANETSLLKPGIFSALARGLLSLSQRK
jgi:hypothetical protein